MTWILTVIIVVGWPVGWGIGWLWSAGSVRIATRLVAIHRCAKTHPDWTHAQWVQWVHRPRRARLYKQHGLEP